LTLFALSTILPPMKLKLIFLFIFLSVLAYITLRAALLGITYDEAWTLSTFVPLSIQDIFLYNPSDANNQILNTLLIKLFFAFGNHSLFIARLPNVFAFVVYSYFAFRMTDGSRNIFTGIFLFILLLFNPFVLDFFSLARGYGLAMAFQMGSLYFMMLFGNKLDWKKFAISLLFAMLAVLSNFSFLYFFLSILTVGVGLQLFRIRKNKKIIKVILTAFFASVLLTAMVALPLTKLINNGGLYYGGSTGFYHDTLVSLFAFILYHPYDTNTARAVLNISLFLLVSIIVLCFIKKQDQDNTFLEGKTLMICLLTSIAILINLLNHYITGTLFLIDRTALFYIPLMTIILIYWIEELQVRKVNWIPTLLLLSLCILTIVNFGININFKKTISWPFEAHSEKILNSINSEGIKGKRILTIDFSWPFEKSMGYYVEKNKYSNLAIAKDADDREKLNKRADYYIYYNRSLEKVGYFADQQIILNIEKDTAWLYKDEDIIVFTHLNTIAGGQY
jgi:hypothetical protein